MACIILLKQQNFNLNDFAMKTKMMNPLIHALRASVLLLPAMLCLTAFARPGGEDDKSLSPYFYIPGHEAGPERMVVLESTGARVRIAGVIANVDITQVYKNTGTHPLEAIYVFPASTRAALYRMKMTIGERVIEARIEERAKAREDYEQARDNGMNASLLEQERPNVFSMHVANIMPGHIIKVEMSYAELLIPEAGVYAFVYPTVVGPRYAGKTEDIAAAGNWVKNPYTAEGENPLYSFGFEARINAGMPLQELGCATHSMDISFDDPATARVKLKEGQAFSGNRDLVLRYRLAGGRIESGLLLFEDDEENFFLAMVQPPARPSPAQMPPREYVFIVDVSGSMYGFPLDVSKELMKNLLGNLSPADRFNILLFAGGSSLLFDKSAEATPGNIRKGIEFIDRQQGGGGTELLPALRRALALEGTEDFARTFVIVTDGYVSVEREAFGLIGASLGRANFFPFGIGSSVNRYIIEGMAAAGKGTPFVAASQAEADVLAEQFRKYISAPVLTNINLSFDGFDAYDTEPLAFADVFAERPLLIYGKWKGKPAGKIRISGRSGEGLHVQTLDVGDAASSENNVALKYLWARERIRKLDDLAAPESNSASRVNEVTALGLKYQLLTAYTSFVAIDNQVRNADGGFTTVSQALPLPQGVSNNAVGAAGSYGYYGSQGGRKSGTASLRDAESSLNYRMELPCVHEDANPPGGLPLQDEAAVFTGHPSGIEAFFREHVSLPASDTGKHTPAYAYVTFNIDEQGRVSDAALLFITHPALGAEALRLIALTDRRWKPAQKAGKPVPVQMVLRVDFPLR